MIRSNTLYVTQPRQGLQAGRYHERGPAAR